jgi:hypothetical protein
MLAEYFPTLSRAAGGPHIYGAAVNFGLEISIRRRHALLWVGSSLKR